MSQTGVNKVILIGNAGENAELRFTPSDKPVANFSVAVNESFKNGNGEKVERAEWFRCVAWNGLAEVCGQYLTQGKQVYLEGRLQTRKYDNKEGNARTVTEVVVSTLRLLGGPRSWSSKGPAADEEPPSSAASGGPEVNDDVPF